MVVQDTDRYGRTVGRVYVGNLDVNAEMIRQGAAWVYRDYAKDPSLYRLENEAKAAKRGIDMESAPLEKLDELWDEAKAESRK